jgi:hypothetical protein
MHVKLVVAFIHPQHFVKRLRGFFDEFDMFDKSDKAPTNKIYRRASSEQRPRTRSCHESERLV